MAESQLSGLERQLYIQMCTSKAILYLGGALAGLSRHLQHGGVLPTSALLSAHQPTAQHTMCRRQANKRTWAGLLPVSAATSSTAGCCSMASLPTPSGE